MDKQDSRQNEMDSRYKEGLEWRNGVREEDKAWREKLRREDKQWRELVREEDKAWREALREEDKATQRTRSERNAKRYCALAAAAQTAKSGAPLEQIFAAAKKYEEWLDSQEN